MKTFLISYDLSEPALNRDSVTSCIMSIGDAWARPLAQTWYVRSERDADEIETELADYLGEDDGLVVQAASEDVALSNTALRWFRRRPLDAQRTEIVASDQHPAATADILSFRTPAVGVRDRSDMAA